MEEVVIVISDLYLTSAAEAASIRGVELPGLGYIARYGASQSIEDGWRSWLASWVGQQKLAAEAPASVAAAASRAVYPNGIPDKMVWLATPVHFVAGLASVHLDARGLLQVESEARRSLAAEFNSTFAGSDFHLEALGSTGFLLTTPQLSDVSTVDPARVLGASITEALPAASEAPALRRLSAEVEMWLHDHRLNQERVRAGRLPISAFWLWGGGAAREGVRASLEETFSTQMEDTIPASAVRGAAMLAATASPPPGVAFGSDPYLHGLWRACGASANAAPDGFDEVLGHTSRRAVFVIELSQAFDVHRQWSVREALLDADQRWIVRALDAQRRGDVARVTVVANDHRLSLGSRDRLKLWRMPRPALLALQ